VPEDFLSGTLVASPACAVRFDRPDVPTLAPNAYCVFTPGVSGGAGAVPEPSTWAMMMIGAGMTGGAMRLSRRDAGKLRRAR
jgi:hypothetical protein